MKIQSILIFGGLITIAVLTMAPYTHVARIQKTGSAGMF